jgi:hypothetical protein
VTEKRATILSSTRLTVDSHLNTPSCLLGALLSQVDLVPGFQTSPDMVSDGRKATKNAEEQAQGSGDHRGVGAVGGKPPFFCDPES